jgi:anti-sigma factor RsiW
MTPCRRVQPLLEAFADGELAADKVLEVEQHLVECAVCTERVRFGLALHSSTRRAVQSAIAPSPAFVERLQAALDAEHARENELLFEREPRGKLLPWRAIVPVAAAAAFTLVWAASTGKDGVSANAASYESANAVGNDRMGSIASVEQLVDELVSYHAKAPAPQVTEPTLVQQLEPEVGVPVRLPSMQHYGARWEGARWEGASVVVPMRDQRAASFRYNLGSHRVTLYVYDSNRFRLRAMLEPRVVRDQPVYVGTRRGYSIAAREQRGLGYAVATDLDDRESAELVASIR